MGNIDFSRYDSSFFDRGRSRWIESIWLVVQFLAVSSAIPGSAHRVFLLRAFGADIGVGVRINPRVRVKFPWRLTVGDYSWIGEDVWIDNLALVSVGSNVCVSQGVYLCTGSHDWSSAAFDLVTRSIHVEDGAWICAKAIVGPGVRIGPGAVLALGGVATQDLRSWTVYGGNPSTAIRQRSITHQSR